MVKVVNKSLAALLSGNKPPFEVVNCVLYILAVVSPKSKKDIIFRVSLVVPVLFVIQTSIFVMLIGELIKGKF